MVPNLHFVHSVAQRPDSWLNLNTASNQIKEEIVVQLFFFSFYVSAI